MVSLNPLRATLPMIRNRAFSSTPSPFASTSTLPSATSTSSTTTLETSPSPPPPTDPSKPTHYLIKLHRSAIGLPPRSAKTLAALGLQRRLKSVLFPFSPWVAGQILAVKELVEVWNVTKEEGERRIVRSRSEGSGVEVVGKAWGGGGKKGDGKRGLSI